MSDSGKLWLEKSPEDWLISPAWSIFKERGLKSSPNDKHLTPSQQYGVITQQEYMEITGSRVVLNLTGSDNMKAVRGGDYVIHLRSFQGGIEFSVLNGKVSNAYTVLEPAVAIDEGYFRHLFKSEILIEQLSYLTDQLRDGQNINYARFARMSLPLPPIEAQRRIADYLDRETGQIDAMIDKLGELEVTLNDRRVDAVKRAIASDTSIAIGIMVDVTLGKMLQPSQKRPSDAQRPYLRAAHVQPGGLIDFEVYEKQMWFSETEIQVLDLRAGDTVVVEGGAGFGRAAHLTEDLPGWGFQNSIIRLRGSESDGRYLMYALHAALDSGAIHVACNAATFAHFTAEKVESFRVPFHEPAERARIANHLDDVTSKIDAMLAKVAQLKDLLSERRAALITDVVTGRKDVA